MRVKKTTKIKRLIKEAGIKQKDIAAEVGVTPQFVSSVVTGKRSTMSVIKAIAASLGKPVAEIYPEQ